MRGTIFYMVYKKEIDNKPKKLIAAAKKLAFFLKFLIILMCAAGVILALIKAIENIIQMLD